MEELLCLKEKLKSLFQLHLQSLVAIVMQAMQEVGQIQMQPAPQLLHPKPQCRQPPTIGPRILGTRLTNAKTETPSVRLFFGTIFESYSIVAGREIADQEIKNIAPTNTAHHVGMKITQRYPSMERKLKNNSARLVPRRSLK